MNNVVNLLHKDEEDSTNETQHVNIDLLDNGYVVHVTTEANESKLVFSYNERVEMMKYLEEVLGV